MATDKKIDVLVKQGFDRDVIVLFVNCGVDKHLLWFLGMYKKGLIEHLNGEEIRMINSYFEKTPHSKSQKSTYKEALLAAKKFEQNEVRKMKNIIYRFDNGFYISVLNSVDLAEEGSVMSNCVGTYVERVSKGIVGILALKHPTGRTVCHIEIKKNGMIGQNYAKANMQVSKEYWNMILEFFEKNSKSIDFSNLFGESYLVSGTGGYINEIILSIPTSVNLYLQNGEKISEQINGFEVKRFSSYSNYNRNREVVNKLNTKEEVINWIKQRKNEVNRNYDELIDQILITSADKLYLSDEIKEKIFGNKKMIFF